MVISEEPGQLARQIGFVGGMDLFEWSPFLQLEKLL
jgi:hypothetical protein